MYTRSENRIFGGKGSIRHYFNPIVQRIMSEIESFNENYLLNASEEQLIAYMVDKYTVNPPEILFENAYIDDYETEINTDDYPEVFRRGTGEKHKVQMIRFYIPVTTNAEVLKYMPDLGSQSFTIGSGSCNFEVTSSGLTLEVPKFYDDPKKVKDVYDENLKNIGSKYENILRDIKLFNASIRSDITGKIRIRKSDYMKKNEFMYSLGVPLKRKQDTPTTFSIPQPNLRTKIVVEKPVVTREPFKAEPTIPIDIYFQILKLIHDVGKNFERLPSIYEDKGEEDLRDHIIMVLDPNFQNGSATGETFNKTGKTDIQLRYDSSVVFVAECKFWSGEKGYLSTITQLLKYLTWRDTKASVIMFVRQKDFTSILSKVKAITSSHQNYLGFVADSDENWFNYRFHINGDKNREVNLAVQLYHLP